MNSLIGINPNPSLGEFIISITSISGNKTAEIYNTVGQLIFREPLVSLQTKINLSEQANGVYFVRIIENGNTVYYSKIIKE